MEIRTIRKKIKAIELTITAENKGNGVFNKLTSTCWEETVEVINIKNGIRRARLTVAIVERAGEAFNLSSDNLKLRAFFTSHAKITKVAQMSIMLFEEGMKKAIA